MSGARLLGDCFRFCETRLSQDGCRGILDSGGFWKRLFAWERDWWKSGGGFGGFFEVVGAPGSELTLVGVREREVLPCELIFPDDEGESAFVGREAERRAGAQVYLVGPERKGFWLKGDKYFLSVVVFREFCKVLRAIFVERDDRYVSYGVVGGLCGCLARFVYAREHEVVSKFRVEVAEFCGPISKHGVELEAPEFVLSIGRCSFLEECREIEWVTKSFRVEREEVTKNSEQPRGACTRSF